MYKNKTKPLPLTRYKNQLQMDQRPQCETQNYENGRRKCWQKPKDIGIGKVFVNQTADEKEIRSTIDKWGLIKLRSTCTVKERIKEGKKNTQSRR